jgi:threonylcarbamoyladenosine tRNA methylthiotransferase CDKAL1
MKVFVKTYGCSFNQRDSENIKGILQGKEYIIVNSEEEADMIVVNSCGVKGVTQNKVISYVQSRDKPVYVGGCLPRMVDMTEMKNVKGVFDPNSITQLPKQIEEKKLRVFSGKKEHRVNIPIVRADNDKLILPISQGCLGACGYCSVKYVRGHLKSYRIGDLMREVEESVKVAHVKNIYLTSQDCGCYGFDIDTNLAELLDLVVKVEGEFIVRVGMMSPEHLFKYLPEFIEAMNHPKVMKFVHLPLQSGSNKVLKEMNRKYTIEEFKELVSKIRIGVPGIHIATDIIVGYPTETEQDFQETVEIVKDLNFEVLNISKFASRPKTPASKLKPLLSQEVKRRSKIITELIK